MNIKEIITFNPVARVEFTVDELRLLYQAAEHHYDRACRQAAVGDGSGKPGLIAGLLDATVHFPEDEVALMGHASLPLAASLYTQLRGALVRLNGTPPSLIS